MGAREEEEFERAWAARFREFGRLRDDDAGIAGWTASGLAARLRQFEALLGGASLSGRWLDAGCGAGTYARLLRELGAEVVGLDYSLESLHKAAQRTPPFHAVTYCAGTVTGLPFPEKQFEGALCFGVTQALADSGPAVRELLRVLRPRGELWIDGLNRYCLPTLWRNALRRWRGQNMHLRYEAPYRLRQLLRRAGCETRLYWLPVMPRRLAHLQPLFERPWMRALLRYVPGCGAMLSHSFVIHARLS